jgi:hypothetical protein
MSEAARSVIMQHMGWCLMSDVRSPTELKTWMRLRSKDGDEVLIPRDNWYLRAARLFTYYPGQSCSLGDWWYVRAAAYFSTSPWSPDPQGTARIEEKAAYRAANFKQVMKATNLKNLS